MSAQLPEPRLAMVYRLEPAISEPLVIGDVSAGHRRIIRLDGGTVTGPEINGKLLTGVSADWQIVLPDGTALIDIRYTLQTDGGDLVYVQSRGVRVGRGGDDTVLRTSTQIETASRDLDWMNREGLHQRRRHPPGHRDLGDLPGRIAPSSPSRRKSGRARLRW